MFLVASFTDAWIETSFLVISKLQLLVASFTDAWIETLEDAENLEKEKVASFTDAWIETDDYKNKCNNNQSHLLQMRGLKLLKWAENWK